MPCYRLNQANVGVYGPMGPGESSANAQLKYYAKPRESLKRQNARLPEVKDHPRDNHGQLGLAVRPVDGSWHVT